MKPKDLLEYLETGNRSMEHLKAVIDQKHEVENMNQLFEQAYRQGFSQMVYGSSVLGGQMSNQGGVRW